MSNVMSVPWSAKVVFALSVIAAWGGWSHGAVLVSWTFEAPSTPADSVGATSGPWSPAIGSGSVTGVHASPTTSWSTPVGNGSIESFNATAWAPGDYFEFNFSTAGSVDLGLSVDASSSATGPAHFKVAYSTDGTTFADVPGGTYTVTNASFSSGTVQTTSPPRFVFDLSQINEIENQPSVTLRLINTDAVAVNGNPVATGGTSRVDNVIVSSDVPEPANFGLMVIAVASCLRRRRTA